MKATWRPSAVHAEGTLVTADSRQPTPGLVSLPETELSLAVHGPAAVALPRGVCKRRGQDRNVLEAQKNRAVVTERPSPDL